ncbi:hypothetical protein GCM10023196_101100 [Actinoallomurus vinaceus]|uniref:Cupin domain-containing protein n=1 Tax=Actinoallomurus vinaceus TaxID=1080074 RepID=A0ABP8UWZ5_9ACTN
MTTDDSAVDWDTLADRHWDRTPVVLRGREEEPPVAVDRAFDVVVAAAAPFRAGTRFRALPDVRFFTAAGRIRAPGDRLPGPDDPTVDHYLKRLDGEPGLLGVEQPLMLDAVLWSRVRDLIRPLWQRVGFPVLPVVAELTIGDDYGRDDAGASTHAVLTWVLRGRLEVRTGDLRDRPGDTLRAGPGDLLYRPAGLRSRESHENGCLALHLRIPMDPRLPSAAVTGLIADLLQARRADGGRVPYLPFPPPRGSDGAVPPIAPLVSVGEELSGAAGDPELNRILRIQWARRVSACGLEPVPEPGTPAALTPDHLVRLTGEVVRMPDEPGATLWAVNGHVFTVRGTSADGLLDRLRTPVTVGELTAGGDGLLPLLHRLSALRGIEVLEGSC